MEFQPIDVNALVAEIFGLSVVIIPVLGFTLRWAIKPVIEAYARAFPNQGRMQLELERLNRRVSELEDELNKRPELPESRERLALASTATDVVVSR